MKILKRINHNAAICLDSKGREVVALGSGVGFPDGRTEIDLKCVERTFYGLDARYMALIEELPHEVIEFSAQMADVITGSLSYELSPGYALTLADHIAFMLKRTQNGIPIHLPTAYTLPQLYPLEWQLGQFVLERARYFFELNFDSAEVPGIVMGILGAAGTNSMGEQAAQFELENEIIEKVTSCIENDLCITIDRTSISFTRLALHVHYLLIGDRPQGITSSEGSSILASFEEESPAVVCCARNASELITSATGLRLEADETAYLAIHIRRLKNLSKP